MVVRLALPIPGPVASTWCLSLRTPLWVHKFYTYLTVDRTVAVMITLRIDQQFKQRLRVTYGISVSTTGTKYQYRQLVQFNHGDV